jgi:hypothetical protein
MKFRVETDAIEKPLTWEELGPHVKREYIAGLTRYFIDDQSVTEEEFKKKLAQERSRVTGDSG